MGNIIVPLYVYPDPGAWDPLYEAYYWVEQRANDVSLVLGSISKHPSLNFTIIVNPSDGPGDPPYPDDNYLKEIPRLNQYPNVRTVGYVAINYASRPIQKVLGDISVYAGWNSQKISKTDGSGTALNLEAGRLVVHGIFFDETPYQASAKNLEYMSRINRYVRDSVGIAEAKMVIHNPGCIPDRKLFTNNPGPDVVVVCELAYSTYRTAAVQRDLLALPISSPKLSYMVHSLPEKEIRDQTKFTAMVRDIVLRAKYIFLTSARVEFYTKFDPAWTRFVEAMDALRT
ncbi:MAG: hypothetical protein M1816_006153 [Peltula sp. TS41687]|nr:MAG: hypothetical protein M1816_006153 [Peltula sp. TS41687]